ncbi:MAG: ABC transporter substrate-binding protein, partial [Candidatus Aenigmatarchaeota archaeon]
MKAHAIIIISLLCIVLSCSKPSIPDGYIVVALESNPSSLDPRLATDASSQKIIRLMFNGLVKLDENMRPVPDLTTGWKKIDEVTYLFQLRKGVKFHNGKEVTASDVKFTFESIFDPSIPSPHRGSYENIRFIEEKGRYSVIFKLKKPFSPFLTTMTMPIIPEGYNGKALQPPGTGPFRLVRWIQDEWVELQANEEYFEGRPKTKGVIFKIIPDDTSRFLELEKGNIHLILNAIDPEALSIIQNRPSLFNVITRPGTNYSYLGFNLRDPLLRNRKVREAIARAIDRNAIIENILKGLACPATGILPPMHWAYEGDVEVYPYSPDKAKALLDEAGLFDPDGSGPKKRMKVVYKTSQNKLRRRIAEAIQAQLAEVGIDLEIRSYEWGTFYADIKSGNFQIYSLTWVGVTDPDIYYYIFHSSSIPPKGANRGGYINPEVDL